MSKYVPTTNHQAEQIANRLEVIMAPFIRSDLADESRSAIRRAAAAVLASLEVEMLDRDGGLELTHLIKLRRAITGTVEGKSAPTAADLLGGIEWGTSL